MPSYTLEIELFGVYTADIPGFEIWEDSVLHSSYSISSSGFSISVSINHPGTIPTSLEFRFNDALGEGGRSIEIYSVRINNKHVNINNYLSSDSLTNGGNATVDIPSSAFIFDDSEPAASEFTIGATRTLTTGNDTVRTYTSATLEIFDALGGRDVIYLGAGNDKVTGGAGNDLLRGGAGDDLLFGDSGSDRIYGQAGDDTLYGGNGADRIQGGDGNDEIHGGSGNDRLSGNEGNDIITGGTGDDRLIGANGDDYLFGGIGNDILIGGAGADTLDGGDDNGLIYGGNGVDIINGGDGDDVISGDAGNDIINGDDGNDEIYGQAGDDIIYSGNGNDEMSGGAGNDTIYATGGDYNGLYGGTGNDTLIGGDSIDSIFGDEDNDIIDGGGGDDIIVAGTGNDIVDGGDGNDTIYADFGDDIIDGGDGNDIIEGSDGADIIDGGAGNDTIYGETGYIYSSLLKAFHFNEGAGAIVNDALNGAQDITINDGTWTETGGWNGGVALEFSGGTDTGATMAADTFGGEMTFAAWARFDNTSGGSFQRIFDFGNGPNSDNILMANRITTNDITFEIRIGTSNSSVTATNVIVDGEWAFWTATVDTSGSMSIYKDGVLLANNPSGNVPSTILRSSNLIGDSNWSGDATLDGAVSDFIMFDEALSEYNVGNLHFWNTTVTSGADTLGGGDGDDMIYGGADADTLNGGADNDVLYGEDGNDTLNGDAGNDALYGGAGVDVLSGGDDDDTLYGGTGSDTLNGDAGTDILYGGVSNDTLNGGAGNDTIYGSSTQIAIGQAGQVTTNQTSSAQWHTITFDATILSPVIKMAMMTTNNSDPTTLRVRNVTDTGFEWQIDEWDYLDGVHGSETVSWLAIAAGTHTLDDGTVIQAGTVSATNQSPNITVNFNSAFGSAPVVMSQVMTYNGSTAVTIRNSNRTASSYSLHLEEQESTDASPHSTETVGWIAIDNGGSVTNGLLVKETSNSVTESDTTINFGSSFATSSPIVLFDMQTENGTDTGVARGNGFTSSSIDISIDEETSADAETNHAAEIVGYYAMTAGIIYENNDNGSDIISGGAGVDILYGGDGADTFIFEAISAFADTDLLMDFRYTQGDILDISDIITGAFSGTITDYVQFVDTGTDMLVQVDANGTTGGASFATIARLEGVTGLDEADLYTNGNIVV